MTSDTPKLRLASTRAPQKVDEGLRASYRKVAEPKPRHQLVSIVRVVDAFSIVSERRASIAEINDVLVSHFDCDNMLYRGIGYGLADAYDGREFKEADDGYHQRQEIILDLYNSKYWERPEAIISNMFDREDPCDPEEVLMTRKYAKVLVQDLWQRFGFDEDGALFPEEAFLPLVAFNPQEKPNATFNFQRLEAEQRLDKIRAKWPWGDHHTKALGDLEAAAQRWWVNYDPTQPDTAPTKDQVSEWLQSERKISKNMADSIASILRADGLPAGPRR